MGVCATVCDTLLGIHCFACHCAWIARASAVVRIVLCPARRACNSVILRRCLSVRARRTVCACAYCAIHARISCRVCRHAQRICGSLAIEHGHVYHQRRHGICHAAGLYGRVTAHVPSHGSLCIRRLVQRMALCTRTCRAIRAGRALWRSLGAPPRSGMQRGPSRGPLCGRSDGVDRLSRLRPTDARGATDDPVQCGQSRSWDWP